MLRWRCPGLLLLPLLLLPPAASGIDFLDGRIQIHGYAQESLRTLSDSFNPDAFFVSQWQTALDLELDGDLAPNGFGPFSQAKIYLRGKVQYDCVYTKLCGLFPSYDLFGDRAARAAPNYTNGRTSGYTGILPDPQNPSVPVQPDGRFGNFTTIPPFNTLLALGGGSAGPAVERTLGLVLDQRFAIKDYGGTLGPLVLPLGPWNTGVYIQPIGALQDIPNVTPPLPLRPLVPNAPPAFYGSNPQGLYVPSAALLAIHNQFGSFDQNFTQSQLAWNRGASQDTYEFKEGYVDLEMLDGRIWFRLGKQDIVWGKTELFRNQDQINPLDLGQTTLGSLEDTRIPLWLARMVYNFYNVGPLEDLRLELVANLGNFMPNDLGRCGEPYTVFLVCGKSVGLTTHGVIGSTLAGEIRPSSVWDRLDGLQSGARLEFRWDRFSFALSDYYGYDYFPTPNNFNAFSRNVDPLTGVPLDSLNRPYALGTPELARQALLYNAGNRQFFDVFCSATVGLAAGLVPIPGLDLSKECALTLFSSQQTVPLLGGTVASLFGTILADEGGLGTSFLNVILALLKSPAKAPNLASLNPAPGKVAGGGLNSVLTTPQQALLGCGAFYGTNCQVQGIDLFNTEASALLQSFPMFEPGGPVATRFVNGHLLTLPGACGPVNCFGRTYNPQVDGCLNASFPGCGLSTTNLLAFNPGGGKPIISFPSVMAALSYNFLQTLTIISFATDKTGQCNVNNPTSCSLVRAIFAGAGAQRPDPIAGGTGAWGRRDFLWESGSEIDLVYPKHNILGFGMDFAEDRTKTNWGVEFSWTNRDQLPDNNSFTGYSAHGIEQLTISVDRPTFVNFLNPNRTFLFNTQWFFRYIDNFHDNSAMWVNGPFGMLGTFTIFTGYYQDRLIPVVTFVHDVRSTSGAALVSVTYRFSEVFSATVGTNIFYGNPQKMDLPIQQPVLQNYGPDYMQRVKYDGLTSIAERNEFSLTLRYTF
jgi:uncharacterized protein DUF1302